MATPVPCIHYATGDLAVDVANVLIESPYRLSGFVTSRLKEAPRVLRESFTTWPVVAIVTDAAAHTAKFALALEAGGGHAIWLPNSRRYLVVGECGFDLYAGCTPHTWVGAFKVIGMDVTTMPILDSEDALGLLLGLSD